MQDCDRRDTPRMEQTQEALRNSRSDDRTSIDYNCRAKPNEARAQLSKRFQRVARNAEGKRRTAAPAREQVHAGAFSWVNIAGQALPRRKHSRLSYSNFPPVPASLQPRHFERCRENNAESQCLQYSKLPPIAISQRFNREISIFSKLHWDDS